MKRSLLSFICLFIFFLSCNKEEEIEPVIQIGDIQIESKPNSKGYIIKVIIIKPGNCYNVSQLPEKEEGSKIIFDFLVGKNSTSCKMDIVEETVELEFNPKNSAEYTFDFLINGKHSKSKGLSTSEINEFKIESDIQKGIYILKANVIKPASCYTLNKINTDVEGKVINYDIILEKGSGSCDSSNKDQKVEIEFNPTMAGEYTINYFINGKFERTEALAIHKINEIMIEPDEHSGQLFIKLKIKKASSCYKINNINITFLDSENESVDKRKIDFLIEKEESSCTGLVEEEILVKYYPETEHQQITFSINGLPLKKEDFEIEEDFFYVESNEIIFIINQILVPSKFLAGSIYKLKIEYTKVYVCQKISEITTTKQGHSTIYNVIAKIRRNSSCIGIIEKGQLEVEFKPDMPGDHILKFYVNGKDEIIKNVLVVTD
jgi:hypothetical protein